MRLGVVSDTHGNTDILHKIVARAGVVGHWLHAGDHYEDAVFLAKLVQAPVTAVAGNCDYPLRGQCNFSGLFPDKYLEINGAKIWLTHGHKYKVKRTADNLFWQGEVYEADIVVFGHTHVPYQERRGGILVFNPGSPSYPRGGKCLTFGILTILGKNDITADIIEVE